MISFLITTYNNVEILKRCLTAFLWQSPNYEYEIILIDNNSNSEKPDDAYDEFHHDLPIFLIKQPKLPHTYSLCRARNIGLRIAKFPWIVTLDADILINPDYLESLSNAIKTNPDIMITGERIFVNFDIHSFPIKCRDSDVLNKLERINSVSNYHLPVDRRLPGLKKLSTHPHPWALMHGGNCVFKKEHALSVNGYDETYDGHWGYEDVDFAYRIITQTNCKPVYNHSLYCYHLESMSKEHDKQRFDKQNNPNWKRICETIPDFRKFKENEYQSLTQNIIL